MTRALMIKELPNGERPRERLLARGAENLAPSELIAILLRTGTKGISAVHIAEQVLHDFKTLDKLSRANVPDLRKIKGIGRDKAVTLVAAFTLARLVAREARAEAPMLDTPD